MQQCCKFLIPSKTSDFCSWSVVFWLEWSQTAGLHQLHLDPRWRWSDRNPKRDGLRWRTSPQQHRRPLVPGLPQIRRSVADSYIAATSTWTYSCLTPTWAQGRKDHVMETLKWPLMSEMKLFKPYFPTVPTCVKMLCVWLRIHLESASGATRSLSVPM